MHCSNLASSFLYKHGEGCQQVMGGDFEIENLADNFSACFKGDKQRWLVSESKEAGDIPITKVQRWYWFDCKCISTHFWTNLRHAEPTPFVVLMMPASAMSTVTIWLEKIVRKKKNKKTNQVTIDIGCALQVHWQLHWQPTKALNSHCSPMTTTPTGYIPTH